MKLPSLRFRRVLTALACALGLIAAVWVVFRWTRLGAQAQATMENPAMARALGVDTRPAAIVQQDFL